MEVQTGQLVLTPCRSPGCRGFTFLEVLFAVIILGVGFIMLAGMFPVAIQQQRASVDDSLAPAIGGGAVATIEATFRSVDTSAGLPAPGIPPKMLSDLLIATGNTQVPTNDVSYQSPKVFSFRDANLGVNKDRVWGLIAGNLVLGADPTLAFVPFYMRDRDDSRLPSKFAANARILIVPVRVRNRQRYDTQVDVIPPSSGLANLEPNLVTVSVDGNAKPNTITFTDKSPTSTYGSSQAVAPGTYVIIADARTTSPVTPTGSTNGYFFQVGANISGNQWELVIGKDLNAFSSSVQTITGDAYLVGKGPDPSNAGALSGAPQDLGVYTGIVSLP